MNPLEIRVMELERKIEEMERVFTVTPTQVIIKKGVQVQGLLNADRVYTQRSGNFVELTT